jgi:hypothetical protein
LTKKQFIFSSEKISGIGEDFIIQDFGDYFVYIGSELEFFYVKNEKVEILLLGFIINPFKPEKPSEEVLKDLAKIHSKEKLFEELGNHSGRYVVFYKNQNDCILFHDMFGQRQINYQAENGKLIGSSSVKLLIESLGRKPDFITDHSELFSDKGFQLFDQWFLGDLTWDKQIRKLLPNHYIDLKNQEVKRIPFYDVEKMNFPQLLEYVQTVLEGNYKAIQNRYDYIFQALTAGYDSRTLLALSKNYWNSIQFYTFKRSDANSRRDAKIAEKLSKKFKFNYNAYSKLKQDFSFEKEYKEQFVIPRTTPKIYNILFFKNLNFKNGINITGDGVQMVRNLRSPGQLQNPEKLFDSLKYTQHPYHIENFRRWLIEAKSVAIENEILISDLFTQEIAQGQLTARWAHEFDLSGWEEFNPFSQKKMIYSILKNIPYEKRISPDYQFHKNLLQSILSEITEIPFNPPTWKDKVKKLIRK